MIEDTDLIVRIRDDFKEAKKHTGTWRSQTQESYKFIAGGEGQWDEQDVNTLRENERPVISFNRIGPYIDAISGNEINSRHTIKYLPRTLGDSQVNELYTAACKWVRDNCNAEDEESDAFVDVLSCGMGWVETAMEYDQEQDGKIVMNRVDPAQMFWDASAKKRNLEDRRWQSRSEWMSKQDISEKWPDKEISPGTSPWTDDPEESGTEPHNASLAFLYRVDQSGYNEKTHEYRVIHYQWWEHEDVYRAKDPTTGTLSSFPKDRWDKIKQVAPNLEYAKQKKRVYYQAFVCADTILEKKVLKCKGFTFKAITGKRNKVENTWYGLVENMKDPQRWANKFFSQILHIINSNAKGGLLAETGAFVDPKKAQESWADPQSVVLLKNGGLSKIKERESAQYPQGLDKLMAFAVGSIPAVSGVNLETMGMVDRDQAGILEQERKKSTFTILAPFFDSLRRYRKEQGRLLFHYINEYISDGRLIRVKNDTGEQWVPLTRQEDTLEYDIIVDESPTSPNQKQEVWATMKELIPPLLKAGMQLPPDFFDYSPLPSELAQKMKASMMGKLPPQVEQGIQKMKQDLQNLSQENQQLKQSMQVEAAKLQSKDGQAQLKANITMEQMKAEYSARQSEMQAKHEQHIMKLMGDSEERQNTLNSEIMTLRKEIASEDKKDELKRWEVTQNNARAIVVAEIGAKAKVQGLDVAEQTANTEIGDSGKMMVDAVSTLANAMTSLHQSLRPTGVKRIKDANGDMVAADVSYQSGETRRIPTH